jgi:hypothetical protein
MFFAWVWPVQMITAGCLAGVSDSVAQKLSGYQTIEKRRLLLKMVRNADASLFCLDFVVGLLLLHGRLISVYGIVSHPLGRIADLIIGGRYVSSILPQIVHIRWILVKRCL